jgi:hypothetical protein
MGIATGILNRRTIKQSYGSHFSGSRSSIGEGFKKRLIALQLAVTKAADLLDRASVESATPRPGPSV